MTEPTNQEIVLAPQQLASPRLEGGVTAGNTVLAPADWQMLAAIAETVASTEFVPEGLRGKPAKVLACMLYGNALDVHPMVALKEIAVIDGTPSMSSALMVAKVMERGHEIWREELREDPEFPETMTGVRAHGRRADNGREDTFTFTLLMARRAGLMGKKNWQNYPEAMLWWRASSQLCSFLFPDVFMGSPYMPEELGDDQPPAGGPERPSAAAPVEATPEQPEPAAQPEAPASEAPQPETEEAETVEGELVDEEEAGGFWTPLDDRAPTQDEYEAALKMLDQPDNPALGATPEERTQTLEAVRLLLEAYELENDPPAEDAPAAATDGAEPVSVARAGTVADLMVKVGEAVERGDREWLEQLLAAEKAQSRPRIRLVEGVVQALGTLGLPASGTPAFVPGAEAVTQGEPSEPGTLEKTGAPAVAEALERFDPEIPVDQLDPEQLLVRTCAVIATMEDNFPDVDEWKYASVITSASALWSVPIDSLAELEPEHLRMILDASPADAQQIVMLMNGVQVKKLADKVLS